MQKNRREFLKASAVGAAALATGMPGEANAQCVPADREPLHILILGGTGFIGPHMVREALRRGHQVTLFNRGADQQHAVSGPRNDQGRSRQRSRRVRRAVPNWDAVIDNSGYVPTACSRTRAAACRLV